MWQIPRVCLATNRKQRLFFIPPRSPANVTHWPIGGLTFGRCVHVSRVGAYVDYSAIQIQKVVPTHPSSEQLPTFGCTWGYSMRYVVTTQDVCDSRPVVSMADDQPGPATCIPGQQVPNPPHNILLLLSPPHPDLLQIHLFVGPTGFFPLKYTPFFITLVLYYDLCDDRDLFLQRFRDA